MEVHVTGVGDLEKPQKIDRVAIEGLWPIDRKPPAIQHEAQFGHRHLGRLGRHEPGQPPRRGLQMLGF